MTARSETGSVPTIVADACEPSWNSTVSSCASETTWLLVTMSPSSLMMNPLPPPSAVAMDTTLGRAFAATLVTSPEAAEVAAGLAATCSLRK